MCLTLQRETARGQAPAPSCLQSNIQHRKEASEEKEEDGGKDRRICIQLSYLESHHLDEKWWEGNRWGNHLFSIFLVSPSDVCNLNPSVRFLHRKDGLQLLWETPAPCWLHWGHQLIRSAKLCVEMAIGH